MMLAFFEDERVHRVVVESTRLRTTGQIAIEAIVCRDTGSSPMHPGDGRWVLAVGVGSTPKRALEDVRKHLATLPKDAAGYYCTSECMKAQRERQ